jgi:hypothetical protein
VLIGPAGAKGTVDEEVNIAPLTSSSGVVQSTYVYTYVQTTPSLNPTTKIIRYGISSVKKKRFSSTRKEKSEAFERMRRQ